MLVSRSLMSDFKVVSIP
ncbi:hypothetical protein bpuSUM_001754 (plasmid) [Borrelia puertoricensis]|nr:hypothetical protein bpuSUM_001754 [Borrelia puertoricensis]